MEQFQRAVVHCKVCVGVTIDQTVQVTTAVFLMLRVCWGKSTAVVPFVGTKNAARLLHGTRSVWSESIRKTHTRDNERRGWRSRQLQGHAQRRPTPSSQPLTRSPVPRQEFFASSDTIGTVSPIGLFCSSSAAFLFCEQEKFLKGKRPSDSHEGGIYLFDFLDFSGSLQYEADVFTGTIGNGTIRKMGTGLGADVIMVLEVPIPMVPVPRRIPTSILSPFWQS